MTSSGRGDHLTLVRHQLQARRGEPRRRRRERHARRGSAVGALEGTQQRAEQLPPGQAARTGGALRNGGEVGGQKGVRQLPGDYRLRYDPPLRAGGSGRGLRRRDLFGCRLDAELSQHLALERPGRVGNVGVLGEQRQVQAEASRTAVVARMVAMPSRRLSCSARRLSVPAAARTRARSSRSSRAMAWNFVRTAGVTRPRWAAASTSTGVSGEHRDDVAVVADAPLISGGAVRRALVWRWPGRAKDSSSAMPGHGGRGIMPDSPADGARNVPSAGPGASNAYRPADLQGSTQRARPASHADPEPPTGALVTTRTGRAVVEQPVRVLGYCSC